MYHTLRTRANIRELRNQKKKNYAHDDTWSSELDRQMSHHVSFTHSNVLNDIVNRFKIFVRVSVLSSVSLMK